MSYKISEVCDINSLNLSKNDNLKNINYLDTANLNVGTVGELQYMEVGKDKIPSRAKRIVRKNDILISTVRPNQKHYGIIKNVAKNMVASTGFAVLTPKEDKIDPGYIYNYLIQDHITTYLHSIAESSTSAYPSIKPSVIGDLEVDLPPLEEQKAIAHILSTLDEKIEINNQINEILENMAQELFKRWFVDFEFPNEDGEPYQSSGGEMVESELGMIPKGWEVTRADNIAKINIGKTPPRKKKECFSTNPNDVKWVSIKDMGVANVYIDKSTEFLTNEAINEYKVKKVPADTVLLSFKLTVGRVAITTSEVTTNEAIAHFNLDDNRLSTEYLYLFLKVFNFDELGNTSSIATAVNSKVIKAMKVIVPTEKTAKEFYELITPIFAKIKYLSKETEVLKNIRDTLLPKLMSGELRVPLEELEESLTEVKGG